MSDKTDSSYDTPRVREYGAVESVTEQTQTVTKDGSPKVDVYTSANGNFTGSVLSEP